MHQDLVARKNIVFGHLNVDRPGKRDAPRIGWTCVRLCHYADVSGSRLGRGLTGSSPRSVGPGRGIVPGVSPTFASSATNPRQNIYCGRIAYSTLTSTNSRVDPEPQTRSRRAMLGCPAASLTLLRLPGVLRLEILGRLKPNIARASLEVQKESLTHI
jgi:hypothetical protein